MSLLPYPTRAIVTAADLPTLYADAQVFPNLPGMDFMVSKSPEWSTGVRRASSGRSTRIGYWAAPVVNFEVAHNVLRDRVNLLECQRLAAFFNDCGGRLGCFFYYDPEDHAVSGDQFGTGDGQTVTFQMTRVQGKGTVNSFNEPVRAFWNTPTITVAGVATSSGWAIAPGGKITFTSPPANGAALAWAGNFLYLCRFDADRLDLSQIVSLIWASKGVKFVSEPV